METILARTAPAVKEPRLVRLYKDGEFVKWLVVR